MVTSRVGALAAFTKKRETCLGCKAVLPASDESGALCSHCKPNETKLYLTQLNKYRNLESQFSKLWTQCQTCQCSLHEEVICTRFGFLIVYVLAYLICFYSRDCPIFYMRKKVQLDLQDHDKVMERFGVPKW